MLAIQRGVPVETFRAHLRVFRWFGRLLTLEQGYERLLNPTGGDRTSVAITFDDGYRDFVSLVLPALRDHQAAATLFPVVRTASGGRALWWDEATEILGKARCSDSDLTAILSELSAGEPIAAGQSRAALGELFCARLVSLADASRDRVLVRLAERLGVASPVRAEAGTYATWDELKSVVVAGCAIGGHTLDHVVLTHEDISAAAVQISDSRTILERELKRPVQAFAYPNGEHNFAIRSLTRAAGYRLAVTVQHGVNYAGTDPYELRRVPIHLERPFHLALKLAFYGCVHRN